MAPPAVTLAGPLFAALRSACGVRVSVSVAVLLPGVGSVVPAGAVTLAVLVRLPVAEAEMLAVTVNVAVPPFARLTVVLMSPVPLVRPQLAAGAHVQVALLMPAGSVSVTVAPVTPSGPALLTTMVYVTVPPGTAVVTPSVLVMLRSACGVRVSVSVAVLLPGVGSGLPAGACGGHPVGLGHAQVGLRGQRAGVGVGVIAGLRVGRAGRGGHAGCVAQAACG